MFRLTAFFAVCLVTVLGQDKEKFEKCHKIFHPSAMRCCKLTSSPPPAGMEDIIKECMQLPGKPQSCERDICIASKRGFATADGKIDKAKATEMIEKDYQESPDTVAAIKEKCINGDLTSFGPPEMCEVAKLFHCKHIQLLSTCPSWDDAGACAGVKEAAAECAKQFS